MVDHILVLLSPLSAPSSSSPHCSHLARWGPDRQLETGPGHGGVAFAHWPLPGNLYITQVWLPVSGHYRPWRRKEKEYLVLLL